MFEEDEDLLERVIFSDGCTFHVSGKVNTQSVRFWGSEQPHVILEHVHDNPKVTVSCAVSCMKVYGLFFFVEKIPRCTRDLSESANY
jgi:hypothetical protein